MSTFARICFSLAVFLGVAGLVYGFTSHEPAGTTALLVSATTFGFLGLVTRAVAAHATGPVTVGAGGLQVTAAVPARDGITTDVVRALDSAGMDVTDIAVRRPSLDDVFLALTGREGAGDQAETPHGGKAA